MIGFFKNLTLWVVSSFLKDDLRSINFAVNSYNLIRWKGFWRQISYQLYHGAGANDIYGNVAYPELLSLLFSRGDAYPFGLPYEKITSAIGKIWILGRATKLGLGLVGFLNLVDKDHCWKYLEGSEEEIAGYRALGRPEDVKTKYIVLFVSFSIAFLLLKIAIKLTPYYLLYIYLSQHLTITWS